MPLVGSSKEQQFGIAEQGIGQAEALLHAQGIVAEAVVCAVGEVNFGEQFIQFAGVAATGESLEIGEVVAAGQVRVERRCFDDCAGAAEGVQVRRTASEQAECAGRRFDQAEQHAHCGRLAGTVGAEKPEDVAAGHLHRELVDGEDLAVPLGQGSRLYHEVAVCHVHRPGQFELAISPDVQLSEAETCTPRQRIAGRRAEPNTHSGSSETASTELSAS